MALIFCRGECLDKNSVIRLEDHACSHPAMKVDVVHSTNQLNKLLKFTSVEHSKVKKVKY
jgi:hypothetical protein